MAFQDGAKLTQNSITAHLSLRVYFFKSIQFLNKLLLFHPKKSYLWNHEFS